VAQKDVSYSLTAAGMGSAYICGHLFELFGSLQEEPDDGLPSALRKVEDPQQAAPKRKTNVATNVIAAVLGRGNGWVQTKYKIELPGNSWQHYYLYGLERYFSFREKAEGQRPDHPNWYEDGARFLLRTQQSDGGWKGRDNNHVATAFSVMFLVRAAKKSIRTATLLQGTMIGGKGLPKDTDSLTVRGGQVVSTKSLKSLDQIIAAIGEGDEESMEAFELMAEAPVEEAETLVPQHAKRLQELAKGDSPEARLAAVRALAKSRDFNSVPILIYALTDPDPAVAREARDGLRRISCRFDGFGMPDEPNETEKQAAVKEWRKWYLAVRPDADFEE
jgi:hypothetical protein